MNQEEPSRVRKRIDRERWEIVEHLERWLEIPMIVLAFVWAGVLIIELVRGERQWLVHIGTAIWIIFGIDFLLRFLFAPKKGRYLRTHWLTALSLIIPALRVFRIVTVFRFVRIARLARSLRLLRVVSSINRGMRALGVTMQQRGFGYVVALTVLVTLVGAAGMLAFEKEIRDEHRLDSYGETLWWTAMIISTMGTDYWPRTTEGRLLCFFLALYAFAVFGYVTATIATFFIGRDAALGRSLAVSQADLKALTQEIAALREELRIQRNR